MVLEGDRETVACIIRSLLQSPYWTAARRIGAVWVLRVTGRQWPVSLDRFFRSLDSGTADRGGVGAEGGWVGGWGGGGEWLAYHSGVDA